MLKAVQTLTINDVRDAVDILLRANIINGHPDGAFNPQGGATRAQMAAMLKLFLEIAK